MHIYNGVLIKETARNGVFIVIKFKHFIKSYNQITNRITQEQMNMCHGVIIIGLYAHNEDAPTKEG